ncbi:cytochrome c oxidase assembly protein [Christiangramia fulva]|nr:cytochrome c oxidase assembly protein [Christiangramia fulva]
MSFEEYIFWSRNWSSAWAVACFIALGVFTIWFRPGWRRFFTMLAAILGIYVVFGSPLNHLLEFGLHSMAMIQHVVIIMLVPLLLWIAFKGEYIPKQSEVAVKRNFVLLAWFAGTSSMWIAHFLSAAKISAETGLVICGISASSSSFAVQIPNSLLLGVVLIAGIFFLTPVFSRNPKHQIRPLSAVIYLFTACVSCSLLGLWVAFSAGASQAVHAAPLLTTIRNPIPMTLVQDQELAGMIMWVPGCVMYVATSVYIALTWLEETKHEKIISEKEVIQNRK